MLFFLPVLSHALNIITLIAIRIESSWPQNFQKIQLIIKETSNGILASLKVNYINGSALIKNSREHLIEHKSRKLQGFVLGNFNII